MEKKQKNEWVVISFFPFSLNKKEKQNVNRWCVSKGETAAVCTAFAISTALLRDWEPGPEAEAVGDIWVLFDFVVLVILEWRVRFPWPLLAFYCASRPCSWKKICLCF